MVHSRRERHDAEFTEFMAARRDQLYRTARLLTGSSHAAEDLVQTALAKAYASWPRVSTTDDPVAYVHRMLINAFLSERRRASSREVVLARPVDHRSGRGRPGCRDDDPTNRLVLFEALASLASLDRAVLVLRFWEDRSVAETASALRLSEAAVKNRSLRSLRILRHLLSPISDLTKGTIR